MNDSTHFALSDASTFIAGALGAIGTGLVFAFTSGQKLQIVEQHAKDLGDIKEDLRQIKAKLDHVVDGLALLGRAHERHAAEMDALRRDITRMEDRA